MIRIKIWIVLPFLIGVPFCLVSTGAGRDEIILTPDSVLTRWYPALRGGLPAR